MFLKCVELGSKQLWFSFNIVTNFTLNLCYQTILPNNYFNPWKMTNPRILKHTSFLTRLSWFLFKRLNKLNMFLFIFPTFNIATWTRAYNTTTSHLYTRCNMGWQIWSHIWLTVKKQLKLKILQHLERSHGYRKP